MSIVKCIVLVLCALVVVSDCWQEDLEDILIRCRKNDDKCIKKSAKMAYRNLIRGIPSLGVPRLETYQHEISGKIDSLWYNLTDTTVSGFDTCDIDHIKLDLDSDFLDLELLCDRFTVVGNYFVKGDLLNIKLEVNGHFEVFSNKYRIEIKSKLHQTKAADGKYFLVLKDVTTYSNAMEKVSFKLDNSADCKRFYGVEDFMNANWKELVEMLQRPFVEANMKTFIVNVNKFLTQVCTDTLFIN